MELKYKYPEFRRIIPSPKQSVNNLLLLQPLILFHGIIFVYANSWQEKSSSDILTNLVHFRCAALTSKFKKKTVAVILLLLVIYFTMYKFLNKTPSLGLRWVLQPPIYLRSILKKNEIFWNITILKYFFRFRQCLC